jgi:hypothetical protein
VRTGNAILDVLIRVVAIALMAALLVWILGVLDAPSILGTIIWIVAVLAIVAVIAGAAYFGRIRMPDEGARDATGQDGRATWNEEPPPGSRTPPAA